MKQYFITLVLNYGGSGVFFGLMLEFLGLPIPGETLMTFLGYLNWKQGGYSLLLSIAFATAGTFTGSLIAFFLGCKFGDSIFKKYGKYLNITADKLESTKITFGRHKILLLIFSRYIVGVRLLIPYIAGISRLKYKSFIFYNMISSILWTTSFLGLGYVLGERWTMVERVVKTYAFAIIALVIFVYIVYRYFYKYKIMIAAIMIPLLLFINLSEDMIEKELSVFDDTIYRFVSELISKDTTSFMKFLSIIGSGEVLVAISLISLLMFKKNKRLFYYCKFAPVNLAASSFLNIMFKYAFHRQRPDILRLAEAAGFSFPSGHSMVSMSFYGFIIFIIYTTMQSRLKYLWIVLLSMLIFLIGISRIYLGVHYASDVAAGFSAGLAWVIIFSALVRKPYFNKMKKDAIV